MPNTGETMRVLSNAQIAQFSRDGFVKIAGAFPRSVADEGRAILWRDTGCDPHDPTTWTKPVIRLGLYGQEPFAKAANTPILHNSFDQLVGQGRWLPRMNLGTFPVRFPSPDDPGDAGWHIDVSFGTEATDPNDFFSWRANVTSKGRALLRRQRSGKRFWQRERRERSTCAILSSCMQPSLIVVHAHALWPSHRFFQPNLLCWSGRPAIISPSNKP